MADLANVFVDIKGKWAAFERSAQTQLGGIGARIGKGMGVAIMGGVGAAVAGGAALMKVGDSFDAMGDTIRVGTGATGDALRDLEQSAVDVATTIPTSFADAGTAIADLNTRLGLTGEPLEGVASQMLELSRITGTDLAGNIATATRTLGDWGVSVEDMPGTLDGLFRASQATGISFDTLSAQMVTYGAPLRQLGFGFEESAALLGKFEKEGVNAELVMGSMRIALGKMARDGEPAQETLGRVVDEIANAGSTSEANALALELFGARAGPDMAAAIREGRFEVGDLVDQIANGGETILDAADDTNSWRQSLQVLTNKGMAKLMPVATRVFDGVGDLLDKHGPKIEAFGAAIVDKIGEAFEVARQMWDRHGARVMSALATAVAIGTTVLEGLRDALIGAIGWLGDNRPVMIGAAVAIGTILVGAFVSWAVAAGAAALATIAATFPLIAIGVAIAALVAGVIYAYQEWGWFRETVDAVASFMTDTLWPIIQTVARAVGRFLVRAVEVAVDVFGALVDAGKAVWRWLRQIWDRSAGLRSFLAGAFVAGVGAARTAFDFLRSAIRAAWNWAQRIWDRTEELRAFLAGAFRVGVNIAKSGIDALRAAFNRAWTWAKNLWDRTKELREFLAGAFRRGVNIAKGVVDGLKTGFDKVRDAVQWVIDKVEALIGWIGKIPSIPGVGGTNVDGGGLVDAVNAAAEPRAKGGPVSRNRTYLVGEQGPELFVPSGNGRIIPNHRIMAPGTVVNINHHGQTVTPATISQGLRMARMR